jgi:hypothetical protein
VSGSPGIFDRPERNKVGRGDEPDLPPPDVDTGLL